MTMRLLAIHKKKISIPVRSLADRAIVKASAQIIEDNNRTKQWAEDRGRPFRPRSNPPHMIASHDNNKEDDNVFINTGMLWVKNTEIANNLLDIWWLKISEDRYPARDFYCHSNNQYYKKLTDCLDGCRITRPGYFHQCGPDQKQEQWINDHENKLFDQALLQSLLSKRDYPEFKRNMELIPQRSYFGVKIQSDKDESDDELQEGINVFFRSHLRGWRTPNVVGYNPVVDRWVHVSGLEAERKNDYIGLWLTRIMNYPVRDKVQYASNDIYPLKKVQLIGEGWTCACACPGHPPCSEVSNSIGWPLYISSLLTSFTMGMTAIYVCLSRMSHKFPRSWRKPIQL